MQRQKELACLAGQPHLLPLSLSHTEDRAPPAVGEILHAPTLTVASVLKGGFIFA